MLTQNQRDTITEIVNIGVGRGSATLSSMVDSEILLEVPHVNVIDFKDINQELHSIKSKQVHAVELKFFGEYEGISNIILSTESASQLASAVSHEPNGTDTLNDLKDGILIEVGNILLNAIMGSFGNILNAPFEYHIPQSYEGNILGLYEQLDTEKYSQILVCRTKFTLKGKEINGEILIIYEINSFNKLKTLLDSFRD